MAQGYDFPYQFYKLAIIRGVVPVSSMQSATSLRLLFDESVPPVVRSRITYVARVFASLYDYSISDPSSSFPALTLFYGSSANCPRGSDAFFIPARYSPPLSNRVPPRLGKARYASEDIALFHGRDPVSGKPDWLGEIFEWLSSSHERSVAERDSIGRIPTSQMIFAQAGLSPWKPQAALLMAWLKNELTGSPGVESLPRASSPLPGTDHLVVSSHDVDFYYTGKKAAFRRLVKNLGISIVLYRSPSYLFSNSKMLIRLLLGKHIGDYIPALASRISELGLGSTLFVVARQGHRRDPEYTLADIAPQLRAARQAGVSVELHGSYMSIIEDKSLNSEISALQDAVGARISGERQHWLRFDQHENLFRAIEDAGLAFDSSLGFTDAVGFRNGACFAFPPYDFRNEKPHEFLEIPLAIMDGSLLESAQSLNVSPQSIADRVLAESRKYGWGGISVLWHNPLEPLSVPDEINQVYWNCAAARTKYRERWVSANEFLSICLPRFHKAGLLTKISRDQCPGLAVAETMPEQLTAQTTSG